MQSIICEKRGTRISGNYTLIETLNTFSVYDGSVNVQIIS